MKAKKEKKTRRYQFAVSPSFGRAFDAWCLHSGVTRTDMFVNTMARVIREKGFNYVEGQ